VRGALAILLLSGCGWFSAPEPVRIVVQAEYPGAAAEHVERAVAEPLEEAVRGVAGLEHVLTVSQEGSAVLFLQIRPKSRQLADIEAQRAVIERLQEVNTLPDDVVRPVVYTTGARRSWLKAGASPDEVNEAVGAQAHQGIRAAELQVAQSAETWRLKPALLREHQVTPAAVDAAVDAALGDGRWASGSTPVGDGITLEQVATRGQDDHRAGAFLDGVPAAVVVAAPEARLAGWTAFDEAAMDWSEECVVLVEEGPPPAVEGSRWIRDGGVFYGRLPEGRLPPGPTLTRWSCALPRVRVAIVGDAGAVDATGEGLQRWAGAAAVLPVPTWSPVDPELSVEVDRDVLAQLGLPVSEVARSMSALGRVRTGPNGERVVLDRPDDVNQLLDWPLVDVQGRWIPLSAVAAVSIAAPARPRVRLDGREARLVDVVLGEGVSIDEAPVADGARLVVLDGLGPDRIWE